MELKARQEPRTLGAAMGHPVEPALEVFIAKGLARNPADRFQSAAEAVEAWRRLRPAGATSIVEADMVAAMDDEDDEASRAPTAVRTFKSWVQSLPVPQDDPGALRRYLVGGKEVGPAAAGAPGTEPGPTLPPESLAPTAVVRRAAQGGGRPSYGEATSTSGGSDPAGAERARFGAGNQRSAPSPYVPVALDPRTSGMQLDVGSGTKRRRPRNRTRMALALVLGAVGLMLVGFGIVALAMQLLQ
jgi:serine/threonine-protein kinase